MITEEDKKEIQKSLSRDVKKILTDVKTKKTGDTPLESFDLVNKAYLQSHGTSGARPTPPATDIGRMYFNVTTGKPNWWTGSGWVLADGTAA